MRALKNLCSPFQAKDRIRKAAEGRFRHPDPTPMLSYRIGQELQGPVDQAIDQLAWPLAGLLKFGRGIMYEKPEHTGVSGRGWG